MGPPAQSWLDASIRKYEIDEIIGTYDLVGGVKAGRSDPAAQGLRLWIDWRLVDPVMMLR